MGIQLFEKLINKIIKYGKLKMILEAGAIFGKFFSHFLSIVIIFFVF